MTDAKHTPTPWIADSRTGCFAIYEGKESFNCLSGMEDECIVYQNGRGEKGPGPYHYLTEEQEANAAFIVRACNNHDALVNALTAIAERTTVQMLCPTAPSQDAADGFKMGAIQATDECAKIAVQALADATK